jgi:demethylmenaquinone methyltransferase / 2-methoxy-6-polyprenyl-1,4-benzoquinol methylase
MSTPPSVETTNAHAPHQAAKMAPHATLHEYYQDDAKREAYVQGLFDETAPDYNRIEAVLAFGSGPWYRRQALLRAGLSNGHQVLDVGIGTGLVAREAVKIMGQAGRLTGVDPSPGMMGQVDVPGVELVRGYAERLPRPDQSADFLSMGYALRHISDVQAAFVEFHRVLKPGGRLCILEITRPQTAWGTRLLRGYMRAAVPMIARVVGTQGHTSELWRYYWDTIEACIAPPQVMAALESAGFEQVQRHVELGIFSEFTARKAA